MVNRIAEDMEWIETVSPTVSPQKNRLFLDVRSPKIMDALASPTKLAAEAKNSTSPFKTEENQIKTPLKEESDESSDSEEEVPVKSKKESPKKEEKSVPPKRKVCKWMVQIRTKTLLISLSCCFALSRSFQPIFLIQFSELFYKYTISIVNVEEKNYFS